MGGSKYVIDFKDKRLVDGHLVYRIRARKGFSATHGRYISAGTWGGFVESEANLSQEGSCWKGNGAL